MVHRAYTDVHESSTYGHAFMLLYKPDSDGHAQCSTKYIVLFK